MERCDACGEDARASVPCGACGVDTYICDRCALEIAEGTHVDSGPRLCQFCVKVQGRKKVDEDDPNAYGEDDQREEEENDE